MSITPEIKKMEKSERNLKIYEERKHGLAYAAIGKKFGVSTDRARQICLKQERAEYEQKIKEVNQKAKLEERQLKYIASEQRIINALENEKCSTIGDLINNNISKTELLQLPYIGRKHVNKFLSELEEAGYKMPESFPELAGSTRVGAGAIVTELKSAKENAQKALELFSDFLQQHDLEENTTVFLRYEKNKYKGLNSTLEAKIREYTVNIHTVAKTNKAMEEYKHLLYELEEIHRAKYLYFSGKFNTLCTFLQKVKSAGVSRMAYERFHEIVEVDLVGIKEFIKIQKGLG